MASTEHRTCVTRVAGLRYLIDKVSLPLGVTRALYLDSDTILQSRLDAFWFNQFREAPLAVADRGPRDKWSEAEFGGNDTAFERTGVWGLTSISQTFNNGVMLIDTQRWCAFDSLGRMVQVAHHHAEIRRLWELATDQPVANVALGGHAHRLTSLWNCRRCTSAKERAASPQSRFELAHICHDKRKMCSSLSERCYCEVA
jgi:lipopolysaccharide biosynthesis glycosyltransferase